MVYIYGKIKKLNKTVLSGAEPPSDHVLAAD
jgi:hypothetical protein